MNSGFTRIRLVPYLRAQYESLKESNDLPARNAARFEQQHRPGPMASCPPEKAHMRAYRHRQANAYGDERPRTGRQRARMRRETGRKG